MFILVIASVFSFLFGNWVDGISILIAIVINTAIGFVVELKATRAMEALQKYNRIDTQVLRNNAVEKIQASN